MTGFEQMILLTALLVGAGILAFKMLRAFIRFPLIMGTLLLILLGLMWAHQNAGDIPTDCKQVITDVPGRGLVGTWECQ